LDLEDSEAKREQREVERLFAESARVEGVRRYLQNAREWADFHDRQGRSLESTLSDLVTYHSREAVSLEDELARMQEDEEA
jgi:hypothetical protein